MKILNEDDQKRRNIDMFCNEIIDKCTTTETTTIVCNGLLNALIRVLSVWGKREDCLARWNEITECVPDAINKLWDQIEAIKENKE